MFGINTWRIILSWRNLLTSLIILLKMQLASRSTYLEGHSATYLIDNINNAIKHLFGVRRGDTKSNASLKQGCRRKRSWQKENYCKRSFVRSKPVALSVDICDVCKGGEFISIESLVLLIHLIIELDIKKLFFKGSNFVEGGKALQTNASEAKYEFSLSLSSYKVPIRILS